MTDWNNFKGAAKRIDDIDIPRIGSRIGVGEDELHAFMDVEAAGGGFDAQGRPKMLFEPHVFYRNLSGAKRAAAVKAGLAYPKWGTKPYPKDSYPRLVQAIAIDETSALRSASWGLGQILGENFHAVGYDDARDMVRAFMDDEEHHLEAMVQFLIANHIDDDLKAHRWAEVARVYNGAGYKANAYDTKLAAAYAKWTKIKDTTWPPAGPRVSGGTLGAPAPPIESPAMPHNPLSDAVQAIGAKAFDAVVKANPALAVGGAVIKAALDKPHVQIEFKDVPAAATEVMSTIAESKNVTLAPVKSAWESKLNWLNGAFFTGVATFLGFHIPQTPEEWAAAITSLVVPALSVVLKTWFSPSVTSASAGK